MPIVNPVAPAPFTPVSLAGTNRFETACAISFRSFPNAGDTDTVVVATGTNWPDALGGAALAGTYNAPILLTNPTSLPKVISDDIKRIGATRAFVLGGRGAVSDGVITQLKQAGIKTVTRLDGPNRYETARKIAKASIAGAGAGWDGTAFVSTGVNFPDALAASPLSAARRWPIYLADPKASPSVLASQMKEDGVKRVIVLGGSGVVSSAYETALRSTIGSAMRLNGADRYDTGVKVATYGVNEAGLMWDGVAIATGSGFPDALAGGALGARRGSVMLLTDGNVLSSPVAGALAANKSKIGTVYYLGGTGAVSTAVRDKVTQTLR
jgi:putative cell wall-binding protein